MMLQRAASNAYSWWWAGHIRTKQSKWLEQSLQDMDEKVKYVLSLIQEEGDSFAKRAEMYYKRRPELISFVEDSYKAFRALAERYDHLSTELQNSNNTLATCFPEQFQLPMDEDDEFGMTKTSGMMPPHISPPNAPNAPKFPTGLDEDLKGLVQKRSNELNKKKPCKDDGPETRAIAKSGLSKSEAVEEIDRLHKDILGLQTVKEYVKSSYQSGLEKYWSLETTIMEKQDKVCNLQDEFDIHKVIEDDQARRIMAEAALKSCQDTLIDLREAQQNSVKEAKEEEEKTEDVRQRLKQIKDQYLHDQSDVEDKVSFDVNYSIKTGDTTPNSSMDLNKVIQEKIKQQFDFNSISSISVTELAEKIDELVSKVINLESSVSSQTALIDRLRSESHELQKHIRTLEDDKAILTEGNEDLRKKVKELQEKLLAVQDINRKFEISNRNLEARFDEAQSSLDRISKKLNNVESDEEINTEISTQVETIPQDDSNTQEEKGTPKHIPSDDMETSALPKTEHAATDAKDSNTQEDDGDMNWQMMLLNGEEDKEGLLLKEYTVILRDYKNLKRKVISMEKKEKEEHVEKVSELRIDIAKRDEVIQYLRNQLIDLQKKFPDTMNTTLSPPDDQNIEDATLTGDEDNYFIFSLSDQDTTISPLEENLRMDIDTILDENLDFWLRFSTSFHHIQKFKTTVEDLEGEISYIRDKRPHDNHKVPISAKSELRPIYKHLKEIEIELKAWLKQSISLKQDVERRSSSLCNIQEKISQALKEGMEEKEMKMSSHQAAKFKGEILNMKQENKKVRDELQAGVDHITSIQEEVDGTFRKLNDEFGPPTRSKIPLRSFLFGSKRKKNKSIFAYLHPNRKYQVLRAARPM